MASDPELSVASEAKCGICEVTLDQACTRWGGELCEIQGKYVTGEIDSDEAIFQLALRLTPEQKTNLRDHVLNEGLAYPKT